MQSCSELEQDKVGLSIGSNDITPSESTRKVFTAFDFCTLTSILCFFKHILTVHYLLLQLFLVKGDHLAAFIMDLSMV